MLRLRTGVRLLDLALIGLFATALCLPAIDARLRPDSARDCAPEMRDPRPRPVWKWRPEAMQRFPEAFTNHFDDTFGLRDWLIRSHSRLRLGLFGVFPSANMYVGRDDWWFMAELDSIAVLRGLRPLSQAELELWRRSLTRERDFCRARGAEWMLVVGPNKETIYPEKLPAMFDRLGPTRMEQLLEHLRAHSDLRICDLRPALLAAKAADLADEPLYDPLGTHWTERGAHVVYTALLDALADVFPALAPVPLTAFRRRLELDHGDTWAQRAYVEDLFPQKHWSYEPLAGWQNRIVEGRERTGESLLRVGPDASAPRLVMFHDSFGWYLDRFLAEHFARQQQRFLDAFEPELVESEKPDVVIRLFVERKLINAPQRILNVLVAGGERLGFQAAEELLFRLDPAAETIALAPVAKAELTRARDERGAGLALECRGAQDSVLTPEIAWPRVRPSWMKLVVESARPQGLDLFYLCEGMSEYHRKLNLVQDLVAGRNELYYRLDDPELTGRLRLRPQQGARLLIRELEIRASAR